MAENTTGNVDAAQAFDESQAETAEPAFETAAELASTEAGAAPEVSAESGAEPSPKQDQAPAQTKLIYLAGGCFWGIQALMSKLKGVCTTSAGYANGSGKEDAFYARVCTGKTGFVECVRVEYDPQKTSLDALLFAFFATVDTSAKNRQGNDRGTQYQSGIFWDPADTESEATVQRICSLEKSRTRKWAVVVKPLENFFEAEEMHQQYLEKNPGGYCHISPHVMKALAEAKVDPARYQRPSQKEIKEKLDNLSYNVTQRSDTERPFQNEYYDVFQKGIYVDKVTGEPLFSSRDKFKSSCGWPAFDRPIDAGVLFTREDRSAFRKRIEVRGRTSDSHLGHVFFNDLESPNGTRFCMNSAALRFIPYEKMDEEGYSDFKGMVE